MPKHTDKERSKNALKRAGMLIFGRVSGISGPKRRRMTVSEALKIAKAKEKAK